MKMAIDALTELAQIGEPIQGDPGEVYIPGDPANNISVRQNNPFNLKGKYWGATGIGTRGFAIYETPEAGWQAGVSQIKLDQSRPLTFAQWAEKYAPAKENPTWAQDVAKMVGASPDTPLADIPTDKLVRAVARRESSATRGNGDLEKRAEKTAAKVKAGDPLAELETIGTGAAGQAAPLQELAAIGQPAAGEDDPLKQLAGIGQGAAAAPAKVEPFDATAQTIGQFVNADTGLNKPERPQDLLAQQEQLRHRERTAQMFPLGTEELPLPEGMSRVQAPRGVFHFDPQKITADEILSSSKAGRENELLGLGPYSKADVGRRVQQGESMGALAERGPGGEELRTALVTPGTLPETKAVMQAGKSPGSTVSLEQPPGPDEYGVVAAAKDLVKGAFGKPRSVMIPEERYQEVAKAAGVEVHPGWSKPLDMALSQLQVGWQEGKRGIVELLSKVSHPERAKDWQALAEALRTDPEKVSPDLVSKVLQGLGSIPAGIAEVGGAMYVGGPAGLAALEAVKAEGGLKEKTRAAIGGALLGKAFEFTGGLARVPRMGAMGAIGAGQSAAAGGDAKDITANAITMATLAAPGGKKAGVEREAGKPAGQEQAGAGAIQPLAAAPKEVPGVERVETGAIKTSPEEFQFKLNADEKTGAGLALRDVRKWDEGLAGIITLWRSPESELYVVNGHQRLDLAKRTKTGEINGRILDAADYSKEEARAYGALINIAEGRGGAVDMAKFFRDSGLDAKDLEDRGISLSEAKTRRALALKGLSDGLFHETALGRLPEERAAVIGEELAGNHPAQEAVYRSLQALEKKGEVGNGQLRELLRLGKNAPVMQERSLGLWGPEELKKSLLLEQSALLDYAKRQMRREKTVFGTVDREKGRLTEAGNVIDPETNRTISRGAAEALDILDKSAYLSGSGSNELLNEFAQKLATTKDKTQVKANFYGKLKKAVKTDRAELLRPGRQAGGGPGAEESEAGRPVPGRVAGARGADADQEVQALAVKDFTLSEARPQEVQPQSPNLDKDNALTEPAPGAATLPAGVREFQEKFGTARGEKPEGLLTGQPGSEIPAETKMHSGGPETAAWVKQALDNAGKSTKTAWLAGRSIKDSIKAMFTPEKLEGAERPAMLKTTMQGERAAKGRLAEAALGEFKQRADRLTLREQYQEAAKYQSGKKTAPDLQPLFDAYRDLSEDAWLQVNETGGRPLAYREHYLRGAYENYADPAIQENIKNFFDGKPFKNYLEVDEAGKPITQNKAFLGRGRSLTGTRAYFKQKVIPDYSTAMMLGLKPKYPLVDLMLSDLNQKYQYIYGMKYWNTLRKEGVVKFFRPGKAPGGMDQISDPMGRVVTAIEGKEGPHTVTQLAYAPQNAARIINNFLSPGLKGQPWYDTYRAVIDPLRKFQVSFSAYHAKLTVNNDLAVGLGQHGVKALGELLGGNPGKAMVQAQKLGKVVSLAQTVENVRLGKRLTQEFFKPGAHPELRETVDDFIKAGGRFPSPETLKPITQVLASSLKDVQREFSGAHPLRLLDKAADVTSKPIMEYLVPWAKLAHFANKRKLALEEMEKAWEGKKGGIEKEIEWTRRTQEITKFGDNMFGQLSYDNLHFSNFLKDLLFFWVKFPGWNIGSARWMTSTARGLGQIPKRMISGQPLGKYEADALKYTSGLLLKIGIFNGLLYYLFHGQAPENPTELYSKGVWTGGYLANGAKEYIRDADYMRDLIGMSTDPVGTVRSKMPEFVRQAWELLQNQDYFGTQIRTPGKSQNWPGEVGEYLGRGVLPYAIQNVQRGRSAFGKYGGFVGYSVTPRRLANTPALGKIDEILSRRAPAVRTRDEAERSKLKGELRELGWAGEQEEFERKVTEAKAKGVTGEQLRRIRQEVNKDRQVVQFKKVARMADAIEVFSLGTSEEKAAWRPLLLRKWDKARPETRRQLRDAYKKVME